MYTIVIGIIVLFVISYNKVVLHIDVVLGLRVVSNVIGCLEV